MKYKDPLPCIFWLMDCPSNCRREKQSDDQVGVAKQVVVVVSFMRGDDGIARRRQIAGLSFVFLPGDLCCKRCA